jgi:hypothetical protein
VREGRETVRRGQQGVVNVIVAMRRQGARRRSDETVGEWSRERGGSAGSGDRRTLMAVGGKDGRARGSGAIRKKGTMAVVREGSVAGTVSRKAR